MLELTSGKLETIRLKGQSFKYRVRRSASAKRRRLQVSPGGVVVTLLKYEDDGTAVELMRNNASWVLQELRALKRRAKAFSPILSRPSVLFRGTQMLVSVDKMSRAGAPIAEIKDAKIVIHALPRASPSRTLERWLRESARRDITSVVEQRSIEMGVRPNQIFMRSQRTKWGNCSRLRNLSFNWRLIMAPPGVLDYLVVHELAHLKEMSHSPQFWLIVQQACPGFEEHRTWLRRNGHRLSLPSLKDDQ